MKIIQLFAEQETGYSRTIFVCGLFSLVVLMISLFHEIAWQEPACRFCKFQRIPYFIILLVSFLALSTRFHQIAMRLIQICFVGGVILAALHLSTQLGLIPDTCAVPLHVHSIAEFQQMLAVRTPSCSRISWDFLGLPISVYNVLSSLLFLVFLRRKHREKKLRRSIINHIAKDEPIS